MKEDLAMLQDSIGERYRLRREIGHGGMATVYLAEDSDRGEQVAVKVLRRELTVALGATRFHREIQILTGLEHPNIVAVLDSREAGARLYYVMPYISGNSMRVRLDREGPLPLEVVGRIAADVAKAIDYAHGRGVLHRDIKPENVLLEGSRALVCDFGVARAIEVAGGDSFSSSGLVIGTPAYMSPEQAAGDPVGRSSDVYALGCLMYEMLAGEPPFSGATAQAILARKLVERPRALRVVRPGIPAHLEEAILAALSLRPELRPATARELAAV
jgi:serine/threonine-protein kinase